MENKPLYLQIKENIQHKIEEGVYGKIGIVGPKRMDYDKVVGTLQNLMTQLDEIFKHKS